MQGVLGVWRQSVRRVLTEASGLLDWWLNEARSLADSFLDRAIPDRRGRILVDLARVPAIVSVRRGSAIAESIELAPSDSQDPLAVLDHLSTTLKPKSAIAIALPPHQILNLELWLPGAAERDLDEAIQLQLERRMPLPLTRLYLAWKIADHDHQYKRVRVAVAAVKRAAIDHLEQAIVDKGLRPISFYSQGPADNRFEFLPRTLRRRQWFRGKWERRLAALAALLSVLCVLLAAIQMGRERSLVNDALEAANEGAGNVRKMKSRLRDEQAPLQQLQAMMTRPSVGMLLPLLSRAVPADSWIYQVDMVLPADQAIKLKISGYTPEAAGLVRTLQGALADARVELLSSMSAGTDKPVDRVDIQFTWPAPVAQSPTGSKP